MAKRPTTRDRQTSPFNFFAGVGGALRRWSGARPEGNPASVPPNMFRVLENVRYYASDIVERGGQEKLTANTLGGAIRGIFDTSEGEGPSSELSDLTPTRPHLYLISNPIRHRTYDSPKNTGWTTNDFPNASYYACLAFGDRTRPDKLITRKTYVLGNGASNLSLDLREIRAGGKGHRMIATLPIVNAGDTVDTRGKALGEYRNNLWFAYTTLLSGGANAEIKVYKWDGLTATLDHTHTMLQANLVNVFLCEYREDLFLGYGGAAAAGAAVKRRLIDGTWGTIALPGGITQFYVTSMKVFKDKLYIAGADVTGVGTSVAKILVWDGSATTVARTPNPGAHPLEAVMTLEKLDGYLYFVHQSNAVGSMTNANVILGRFDGTTWTDSYKDLSGQFGDTLRIAGSLRSARGDFWLIGAKNTGGVQHSVLVRSRNGAFTGTWEEVTAAVDIPSNSFPGGGDVLLAVV